MQMGYYCIWLLCLIHFIKHDVFKVYPYYSMYHYIILFYSQIIIPILVIYLSVDRHLEYFHFEATIKMLLYLCRCSCVDICFDSLGYPSRGEIAESCGNSMFKLLRNCQVIFQNRCIILHSHQQCMRVQIFPHPHYTSYYLSFLLCHPSGYEVVLIVVLIYISMGEYFMCLLATCRPFLEKCLKVELFAVLLLGCNSSSYILVISLLPIGFANKYVLSF